MTDDDTEEGGQPKIFRSKTQYNICYHDWFLYTLLKQATIAICIAAYVCLNVIDKSTDKIWHVKLPGVYAGFIVKVDPTTTTNTTRPFQLLARKLIIRLPRFKVYMFYFCP